MDVGEHEEQLPIGPAFKLIESPPMISSERPKYVIHLVVPLTIALKIIFSVKLPPLGLINVSVVE